MTADTRRIVIKEFLVDGPKEASHMLVLAHGAGVGMASTFMDTVARGIAGDGIRVVRFHFPYMEQSVRSGRKRPPDGGAVLEAAYSEVIRHCIGIERCPRTKLVIGGKSMGGRIASMVADEHGVAGVLCLGYPFHPPKQPQRLRIHHLLEIRTPVLICQGERDRFGTHGEITELKLSQAIRIHWIPDGSHSFKPRKRSGRTEEQNLAEAVAASREFILGL